jgi:hypothetical protein
MGDGIKTSTQDSLSILPKQQADNDQKGTVIR